MVEQREIAAAAGRLRSRLEVLQDHQRSVWFGEGMGLLFAVLLPILGGAMVLDNLLHLHFALRLVALLGMVGAGVLVVRSLARRLREPLTPERMAVKVEAKFPQVDNRFINSLLLAKEEDKDASELIRQVIEEGNADAARVSLRAAIPKRRLAACAGAASLAFALMGFYAVAFPAHFMNALMRLCAPFSGLAPLSETQILAVEPKDKHVLTGDDVAITAEVSGRLPRTAEVVYEVESEGKQVAVMQPLEDCRLPMADGRVEKSEGGQPAPGSSASSSAPHNRKSEIENRKYTVTMPSVSRSFAYRVAANDAQSETYRITAHHRPVISALDVTVTPPAYTDEAPRTQKSGTIRALPGSTVAIRALCSERIAKASLALSTAKAPVALAVEQEKTLVGSFQVTSSGTYRIELADAFGFQNKPVDQTIEPLADDPPEIKLDSPPPPQAVVVKPDASVPFQFTVTDQYGVHSAEIVQLTKGQDGKETDTGLKRWETGDRKQKVFSAKHEVPVASLGLKPGQSGTLQVVARDWRDVGADAPGVARSLRVVVTVLSPEVAKSKSQEAIRKAALELAQIIQKQRQNLLLGKGVHTLLAADAAALAKEREHLGESVTRQEDIRAASGQLVQLMKDAESPSSSLPIRGVLEVLYENEMLKAVEQLRGVGAALKPAAALATALETERTILTRLTGRSEQLRSVLENAALRDLFALLDELQREQKKIRTQTDSLAQAGAQPNPPLAGQQDKLSGKVVLLKEQLAEQARITHQSEAQQAKRLDDAASMVDARKIRPNMLRSADRLEKGELSPALPIQDTILADLKAIADFLREPVVAAAAEKLKELQQAVADAKDKAERLAKLQASVKELSEEMERAKDTRSDKGKELAEKAKDLQDLRDKIEDSAEKMAKDLSLFPEVPTCNELVQQINEIFEDIKQVPGSEKEKGGEIAVDRDEGMLDALEKTKERLADMEKWLMDKPDNIAWKQEGWDKDEMPKIPLVDLPEKLEDIVGDLVDKEKDVDEESQDSSSNAATADIPAGWDTADGPISNWSAKGASGNEKPNANELAGRSGAGREGQADGELVEGKAKDLEGREPEARRTKDPFGDGQIEEEPGSKAKAKATGGGKQSGTGGEGGLRGAAPARDELHMRNLERRQRELRRNTESVYSKACLLYLPTGELDKAVLLMAKAEEQARAGDYAGFSETQKRIVHALQSTRRQIGGKGAVEMDPRHRLPVDIKEEMFNARDEPIPTEFERLVADYYKAIAAGAAK